MEHETTREQLEGEVNHLTQLLQGALRKQDEMALEAADAWQKVRGKRSPRGAERNKMEDLECKLCKTAYLLIRHGRIVRNGRPCRSW